MRILIRLSLALTLAISAAFAQAPEVDWSEVYGGTSYEVCNSIVAGVDDGYLLAGKTNSFGAGLYDFYAVKTDGNGDTVWTRTFGGLNNEECEAVIATIDNCYLLIGYTRSFGPGTTNYANGWIVKVSSTGDSLWSRYYGGTNNERFYSGVVTSDGGYVFIGYTQVGGSSNADVLMMKANSNGDSLWSRTFGATLFDIGWDIVQTVDDGFLIVGQQQLSTTNRAGLAIKTDSIGIEEWTKILYGSYTEAYYDCIQTIDGGYMIGGETNSFGAGSADAWAVRLDTAGDTLWTRTFGFTYSDKYQSVSTLADGSIILAGTYSPIGSNSDMLLVKYDTAGNTVWSATCDFGSYDNSYDHLQTEDEGFVLAGRARDILSSTDDFGLVKTGPECYPPEAPTGLSATDTICAGVLLEWTDNSNNESGFVIKRDAEIIDSTLADQQSYLDNTATPDQIYTYVIWAYNSCTDGPESNIADGSREILPGVNELILDGISCDMAHLEWAVTDNSVWIYIFRNDTLIDSSTAIIGSFDDTEAGSGNNDYKIQAWNDCGLSTPSSTLSTDLVRTPPAITDLSVDPPLNPDCDHMVLSWTEPEGDYTYFRLYRNGEFHFEFLAEDGIPDPYRTLEDDIDVSVEVMYSYTMTAYNEYCGESEHSNEDADFISAATPPIAPEITIVTGTEDVVVSWDAVTETQNGCPVSTAEYLIYFAEESEGPYWFLGYTSDTSYVHQDVVTYTATMFYEVEAFLNPVSFRNILERNVNPGMRLTREEIHRLMSANE